MNASQIFIIISIAALAVVLLLVFLAGRRKTTSRLSPLAGLAFAFILLSVLFGENRWIGYGLMGVGVILAVVDLIRSTKKAD